MSSSAREFPPRPLVPVVSAVTVGLLVATVWILKGSAAFVLSGVEPSVPSLVLPVAVGGTLVVFGGAVSHRFRRGRWFLALGIGLLIGCIASSWWVLRAEREYRALDGRSASQLSFRIAGDPTISDGSYSYHAEAFDERCSVGFVRLVVEDDFPTDSIVRVVGRMSKFDDDEWGRARYFKREMRRVKAVKIVSREAGSSSVLTRFRDRMVSFLMSRDPSAGPLVAGVICGRSSELKSGEAGDWFSRTGTSHLIAVSGSHLALACFLVEDVAARIGAARTPRCLLMLAVGFIYTLFTGASASAVRSCCMVASGLFVELFGRRRHSLSALFVTMTVLCVLDPAITFDLGFQLSCASVMGILLFAPYLGYVCSLFRIPEAIASPLSLTLCAQVSTAPLTIPAFGSLSLIAPFANFIIGPVVSVLLMSGVICAPLATLLPPLMFLVGLPLAAARCVLFCEQLLSTVPFASMPHSFSGPFLFAPWVASAALLLLWPRPHPSHVLGVIVSICMVFGVPYVYWDRFAPPSVTVLDVGQADAILIRQGASAMLVDAGVDGRVVDALVRQNVHRLDAVLVTHWDEDHWGGLPHVLGALPVRRVLVAEGASDSEPDELAVSGIDIGEVAYGDTLRVGSFSARCVWPRESVSGLENAESLCLLLDFCENGKSLSALLTGDSEVAQEREYSYDVGDVDVLKLGHHGSKVSVDGELLQTIEPELCVASAGEGNRYGHPSKACRDAVRDFGSRFVCTIDAGDVTIEPGDTGPRVSLQRGSLDGAPDDVP